MSNEDYQDEDYSQFQSKWVLVATWHNVSGSTDSTEVHSTNEYAYNITLEHISEMSKAIKFKFSTRMQMSIIISKTGREHQEKGRK